MAHDSVLLVEGEPAARSYLEQQLSDDGFAVLSAEQGRRALDLVEEAHPDLVVLDVALPDASGFEVCRTLREGEPGRRWNRDVPVILVAERADPVDRLRGFARGCDDYLVRPFMYEELVARMRAVLRRSAASGLRSRVVVGDLTIDAVARTVRRGDEMLLLAAKEYELLVALAAEPDRVFQKEELLRDVWGYRSMGRTRTLDSHASRLRRKLNQPGEGRYVVNRWGIGYSLVQG
jgi:DNA-binding response OmpR family regulator